MTAFKFNPETRNPLLERSKMIPLPEYLRSQMDEIESALNRWGAGEEFDHDPEDRNERWLHYIHVGRAFDMAEIHSDPIVEATQSRVDGLMQLDRKEREAELQKTFQIVMSVIGRRRQRNPKNLPLEEREQLIIEICEELKKSLPLTEGQS